MAARPFSLSFLPFVRQGLSAGAESASAAAEVMITARADGSAHPVSSTFDLVTSADVVGIAEAMIARVFPAPGSSDLRYNLFPFVEFRDPDFLWRYAYGQVGRPDEPRLAPWLALVVLPTGTFELRDERLGENDPRTVRCVSPRNGSIDLAMIRDAGLWAWAHVQLTDVDPASAASVDALLKGNSERVLSRLVAPVLLESSTAYTAFVVPSDPDWWKSNGRQTGPGVPVFHTWEFRTADAPDFESLFNRIRAADLGAGVITVRGPATLDFDAVPAEGALPADSGEFTMSGALTSRLAEEPPARIGADLLRAFDATVVQSTQLLQGCTGCRTVWPVDAEVRNCACAPAAPALVMLDPYVGPPIYGSLHAAAAPTAPPGAALPWMHELNVDARRRIAAGLGAESIRRNQERILEYCWTHLEELQEDDEDERRRELGRVLNTGLEEKHFQRDDPHRYVTRASPALPEPASGGEARRVLEETGMLGGALAPALRKIARQKIRSLTSWAPARPEEYSDYLAFRLADKAPGAASIRPPRVYDFSVEGAAAAALGEVSAAGFRAAVQSQILEAAETRPRPRAASGKPASGIPWPAHRLLASLSPGYFIPDLDALPPNRVVRLVPNCEFIEAFLVGLNHELMRELVWREFPIRADATLFQRFWERDPGAIAEDIGQIRTWGPLDRLGDHVRAAADAVRSVLLVRADLVRHCPDLVIRVVVASAEASDAEWNAFLDGTARPPQLEERRVLFHCPLAADTLLVGLDVPKESFRRAHVIFSENPSLPRFGLALEGAASGEIDATALARNHVSTAELTPGVRWVSCKGGLVPGVTVAGVSEGGRAAWKHAARAARLTLQRPVQVKFAFDW